MMVMRVLPGEGTTAPRLPRLKSYSLRMLVLRLARTCFARGNDPDPIAARGVNNNKNRSEEHTSELQSLMRTSYAVFCLKKNTIHKSAHTQHTSARIQTTKHNIYTTKQR